VESVVVEDDDNPFGKIFIMMMQSCQPWEMNYICLLD
jgi:hypothetical protein